MDDEEIGKDSVGEKDVKRFAKWGDGDERLQEPVCDG